MYYPHQEGENNISSQNIQFPYYPKQKSKKFFPITPQNNLKNFFPEDFFSNSLNNPQFENVNISFKKMNSDEIGKNQTEKIINNLNQTKENNIIHIISYKIDSSTNSHSTNNTESGNFNSKEINTEKIDEIEEDNFKETPHFFPKVDICEGKNNSEKTSDNIFLNKNLVDGDKVNKEIKNLFDNIPENLKSDPDVNEKVGMLLKNIYEMKQIINNKKDEINYPTTQRNNKRINQNNNQPLSSRNLISNINCNKKGPKGNSRYVKI
jgi:hypothetical protein